MFSTYMINNIIRKIGFLCVDYSKIYYVANVMKMHYASDFNFSLS